MTLQGRKRRSQAITDEFARPVSEVRISRDTVQNELKSLQKLRLGWAGASVVLRELTRHTNLLLGRGVCNVEVDLNVVATNPHNAPALKPPPLAQPPALLLAPPEEDSWNSADSILSPTQSMAPYGHFP